VYPTSCTPSAQLAILDAPKVPTGSLPGNGNKKVIFRPPPSPPPLTQF